MGQPATDLGQQLVKLKRDIKEWEDRYNELKGEKNIILKQLKEEFSLTPNGLLPELTKLSATIEDTTAKLSASITKIQDLMDSADE